MKLSEYQQAADATDLSARAPWVGLTQNIFGLIEKVGDVSKCVKRRLRDKGSYSVQSFRADMERYLGEVLWYLAAVCTHFGVDLETIAERNLLANKKRWGGHRDEQGQLFHGHDHAKYPEEECLPEKITARFVSSEGPNKVSWLSVTDVSIDGIRFGDSIDDNAKIEDGYRYHDVLHLAFAVFLGWSPVVRKLLKRKRKSNPKVDKYEDGARARDTEEAVSNFIHHEARCNNYFKGAKTLDTDFLIKIQGMVVDLEVRDRTTAEWEHCILQAYSAFRHLLEHKGGYVDAYADQPRILFRKA